MIAVNANILFYLLKEDYPLHKRAFRALSELSGAHIAAVCIENGVKERWTADRDFAKFKGLKSSNPLVQ
jgi:predicted nucleic acid-binding protein